MTKTTKKTAAGYDADKIAEDARAQMRRAAAKAKKQADEACESAVKFNSGFEKTMNRVVAGYVGVLGDVVEAGRANFVHAMDTVERMAQAKDLNEAAQIHADFIRENTSANFDRARDVAKAARGAMTEGAEAIRESASGMWPYGRMAA